MSLSRLTILNRFAVMLREKEDTELKPVITEGDTTYIFVKVQISLFSMNRRVEFSISLL